MTDDEMQKLRALASEWNTDARYAMGCAEDMQEGCGEALDDLLDEIKAEAQKQPPDMAYVLEERMRMDTGKSAFIFRGLRVIMTDLNVDASARDRLKVGAVLHIIKLANPLDSPIEPFAAPDAPEHKPSARPAKKPGWGHE